MKSIKKIILLSLVLIPFTNFGQIDTTNLDTTLSFTYEEAIDTIFGALDRSKIPSGILIDRAPSIIQRDMMDGKNFSHIINRDSLLNLYSACTKTPSSHIINKLVLKTYFNCINIS